MSKKHFIALADSLRSVLWMPPGFVAFSPDQREAIMIELADWCANQNPKFNRERWLGYIKGECGPNGGSRLPAK